MRIAAHISTVTLAALLITPYMRAQNLRDFAGSWKLNTGRSDIRAPFALPDGYLRVEQTTAVLKVFAGPNEAGPLAEVAYPLNGKSQKSTVGEQTLSVLTKWEGDALLANIIVSGKAH